MDPISQFAVGGVLGAAFAPYVTRTLRRVTRTPDNGAYPVGPAILCAGLAAMTPDLDVLVRSAEYPLLSIKYHRHFTHAVALAPVYAALLLPIAWLMFRRTGLPLLTIFVLAMLGIATHGPLDAMTNYGTHLWWPFTNARESWSIISIIDPIFTLTLIASMFAATWNKSRRPLMLATAFMLLYWGLGIVQQHNAEGAMQQLAASRGHTVERYEVKPSFGNLIVWRAQYVSDGRIYTDAVNVLPGLAPKVYAGTQQPLVVVVDVWLQRLPETARADAKAFAFFSDGWLSAATNNDNVIGDMRFAMLPNERGPMWAVQLDKLTPAGHVAFLSLPRGAPQWGKLWDMITRAD